MVFDTYSAVLFFILTCAAGFFLCRLAIFIKRAFFDPVDWSDYPDIKKLMDETDALIREIKTERSTKVPEDIQ